MSESTPNEKRRRTKAASKGFSFRKIALAITGGLVVLGGAIIAALPNLALKPAANYVAAWIAKVDKAADEAQSQKERLAKLEEDVRRQRDIVVIRESSDMANASRRGEPPPVEIPPPPPSQVTAVFRQPINDPPPLPAPPSNRIAPPSSDVTPHVPPVGRSVEPARAMIALSSQRCVEIPTQSGALILVRAGDRICAPDGNRFARVLAATPSRVAFSFNSREFSCRLGETCSFDWAYAPMFQLSEASATDAATGVLVLR